MLDVNFTVYIIKQNTVTISTHTVNTHLLNNEVKLWKKKQLNIVNTKLKFIKIEFINKIQILNCT